MSNSFSPKQLAQWTQGEWTSFPEQEITGFNMDTRTIKKGEAFVAIKTVKRDGHDFLNAARASGASCAVVSKRMTDHLPQLVVADSQKGLHQIAAGWRGEFKGRVIGVTGSVGKTSTKDLLGALLGSSAFITEANLNNLLGVPLMLLRLRSEIHRYAVIEAGMSLPGELKLSAQILRPNLAIITAVAPVHLEGVGSIEAVAHEKSEMIAALEPDGKAIIPASLLKWPEFQAHASRCLVVKFEEDDEPAVMPLRVISAKFADDNGRRILLLDGRAYSLSPISDGLGRNAALAVVAALELGISENQIKKNLESWMPPIGRGSIHQDGNRTFYIDCYNSSPASLLDAAQCFNRLTLQDPRRRLFVIGGMAELGKSSASLHRECGVKLPFRAGDTVITWAGDSQEILKGIPRNDLILKSAHTLDEVAQMISNHRGTIFVKGSRFCTLERTLPAQLQAQLSFH
jgi:UDP-N-acetylmuramoyl-tripeptide--D-alanyl-D-alanine ligase